MEHIRDEARDAIRGDEIDDHDGLFDVILADPPYGIREAMGDGGEREHEHEHVSDNTLNENNLKNEKVLITPFIRLVECIAQDRNNGKPLLRKGGRLVAFVPTLADENIHDDDGAHILPDEMLLEKAGLEFINMKEQPLSEGLSRWLVVYRSK